MFKSVFTKYVSSIVVIFVLSFLLFGIMVFEYVSDFAREDSAGSVQSVSRSTKVMVDKLYEYYFEKNGGTYSEFLNNSSEKDAINVALEEMSGIKKVGILIIDGNNCIMLSSEASLLGKKVPSGFYKEQGAFDSSEKINVGDLLDKESFVSAIKLSGTEKFYVMTYSSVDSDEIMISSLIQVISASFVAILLLGVVACYIISKMITSPLKDMSFAAKEFAKGNFNVRVDVRGKDEISELGVAFNNMAKSLGELEQQRSEFLSNVSHDLRTPMTSVSGFIDGILDGTIPKDQHQHYLGIISTEIKRLSRLVRTLLEVTKLEAGARKFNMVDFDIVQMAMTILFTFEKQIDTKMLDVQIDCVDRAFVKADIDAIHQVLYNLIDNAVKFSFNKGILKVSIKKTEKTVYIEVYNEGNGISKADISHVFDRFYKADKSRGMDKTGAGLGLFIVKAIVQAHGETILVESEEGKYCTFKFQLPTGNEPKNERKRSRSQEK